VINERDCIMAKHKTTKKKKFRNGRGGKLFKAPAGWLGSSVAAACGGGGGALLGGILASQDIFKPETTGLLMSVAGTVGGVFAEGHTRTAMHGLAGAGAGQVALAYMATKATPKNDQAQKPAAQVAAPVLPAAVPNGQSAGPVTMPSNGYRGGHVWSAFRDAAGELEILDDDGPEEFIEADGWEDAA
jgi:hypothetical protein